MKAEKNKKETKDYDERWCRISLSNCEVVISSKNKDDSLKYIIDRTESLADKFKKDKEKGNNYIG